MLKATTLTNDQYEQVSKLLEDRRGEISALKALKEANRISAGAGVVNKSLSDKLALYRPYEDRIKRMTAQIDAIVNDYPRDKVALGRAVHMSIMDALEKSAVFDAGTLSVIAAKTARAFEEELERFLQ